MLVNLMAANTEGRDCVEWNPKVHSRDSVWEWNRTKACLRIPLTKLDGRMFAFYFEDILTFWVILVKQSKRASLLDCSSVPTFSRHLLKQSRTEKGKDTFESDKYSLVGVYLSKYTEFCYTRSLKTGKT